MKRFVKVLKVSGAGLLALCVILLVSGVWLVRRPWPEVSGTLTIGGLIAPVQVIRDKWGVPNIYAQNDHDLLFAQGYVHAQDRLWQMDFNRRVGNGTLSAVIGAPTVQADRFLRTLGMRRAAEREFSNLDGDTQTLLQSYADGVNAYIESHHDRLPLEFSMLAVVPERWTPIDTLTWGKVMALNLGGNFNMELLRARLIAEFGPPTAQQLLPPFANGEPIGIPAEAGGYRWLQSAQGRVPAVLATVLNQPGPEWGSNNWVVHGSRTASGKPLLANDTHLGLAMPSTWYENGLHGGRFDSVGFTFPGVPLVIIGHNQHNAWGVTNVGADVQDLYIEQLDDTKHPARYQYQGTWHELQLVPEVIEVKGQAPVTFTMRLTRHGPLINDAFEDLANAAPLALRWAATDDLGVFKAVKLLNLARSWGEFRQALSYWSSPSQSFVYADVSGNIGYQLAGKLPIRTAQHQGLVPVPAWTGAYEWQGFIPFEQLPYEFNPPAGVIATANNKVTSNNYPYAITYEWAPPYRVEHITTLLSASNRLSIDDMQTIQAQTFSLPAKHLLPYLLATTAANDHEQRALDAVRSWDLYFETNRVGASIYQVWYWFLLRNTLQDELGDTLMDHYLDLASYHVPMMIEVMTQADSYWFDNTTTPAVERRDDVVQKSLVDAVAWLSEQYGPDPSQWTWGQLHTIAFTHQPFGQSRIAPLELLFNTRPQPARGDNLTVNAGIFSFKTPFAMNGGAAQRLIVSLDDFNSTVSVHTTGQSGQLLHPHREDLATLWQNVAYHPLPSSADAIQRNAVTTLTLTPP